MTAKRLSLIACAIVGGIIITHFSIFEVRNHLEAEREITEVKEQERPRTSQEMDRYLFAAELAHIEWAQRHWAQDLGFGVKVGETKEASAAAFPGLGRIDQILPDTIRFPSPVSKNYDVVVRFAHNQAYTLCVVPKNTDSFNILLADMATCRR